MVLWPGCSPDQAAIAEHGNGKALAVHLGNRQHQQQPCTVDLRPPAADPKGPGILNLLLFRRAKAARIPIAFAFFSWFITQINLMTEVGMVEIAIGWYQFGLLIALLFRKNKVKPVTP